jgi:hypothetical protein
MQKLFCLSTFIGFQALAVACAINESQPASPPEAIGPTLDPVAVMAVDSSTIVKDTTKPPPITVPSVPGRNKRDSLALVSAIRSGLKRDGR